MKEVHDKLKSFKCESCGEMFGRKWVLKKHFEMNHMQRNLETCDICNATVKHLDRHVKLIHKRTMSTLRSNKDYRKKVYKCNYCEKTYNANNKRKEHEDFHHKGISFKCQFCEVSVNSLTYLNVHIKTLHEKPRIFKCLKCTEEFHNKNSFLPTIAIVMLDLFPKNVKFVKKLCQIINILANMLNKSIKSMKENFIAQFVTKISTANSL